MGKQDLFVFWGSVILLFTILAASGYSLRKGLRKTYFRMVDAMKWNAFLGYIADDVKISKMNDASDKKTHAKSNKNWIFPKARRTT